MPIKETVASDIKYLFFKILFYMNPSILGCLLEVLKYNYFAMLEVVKKLSSDISIIKYITCLGLFFY
ncbi:hypothetical protein HOO54_08880 [Bacillus sp. WMMC1349]|uniref:hypothetical protein n=1 Tax=Bacillus sp. WMMC1349 TaxID=2736254 RepID=UPI00155586A3|nr:hypothetical protein [Bacillus sp. WMMC1349]NPC92333.1 hypothetical protein [Bacillus sp. WMMC1349]